VRRRALLAGLAGSVALSGCGAVPTDGGDAPATTDDEQPSDAPESGGGGGDGPTVRDVYNPTGRAVARPLDRPLVRSGLTAETDQYLFARLFRPGDSVAVAREEGSWLADSVASLSTGEFALLTNLRTATAAPAYWWPKSAEYEGSALRIELERQTSVSVETDEAEAVGVALTVFEYDGEEPGDVAVVLPSGASIRLR
jgi:hypothetical protein